MFETEEENPLLQEHNFVLAKLFENPVLWNSLEDNIYILYLDGPDLESKNKT